MTRDEMLCMFNCTAQGQKLTFSCSTRAYLSCLAWDLDSTNMFMGSSIAWRIVSVRLFPVSRMGHSRSPVLFGAHLVNIHISLHIARKLNFLTCAHKLCIASTA